MGKRVVREREERRKGESCLINPASQPPNSQLLDKSRNATWKTVANQGLRGNPTTKSPAVAQSRVQQVLSSVSKPNCRQGRVGSVGYDIFEQWVYSTHGTQMPILECQSIVELAQNSFLFLTFWLFPLQSRMHLSFQVNPFVSH